MYTAVLSKKKVTQTVTVMSYCLFAQHGSITVRFMICGGIQDTAEMNCPKTKL